MCGIVGIIAPDLTQEDRDQLTSRMAGCIAHRGPDSWGVWSDTKSPLSFGHRRLAIVDLSPSGHQPMHSPSGRFTITFNGEIYNFNEIRAELEGAGQPVNGRSDTAVMLAAFEAWGIERALQSFVGMFAFAVYDHSSTELWIARDRFGEKPLYYGTLRNGRFAFASTLKPFLYAADGQVGVSANAAALLAQHGYIPAPDCILEGVYKLRPGACARFSVSKGVTDGFNVTPTLYYDLHAVARESRAHRFQGSATEATEELERLISRSIQGQLMGDVPIGAFLSGGIDSSTIVALMQRQSSNPIKTFCVGFDDREYNEAPYAAAIAKHLGTDHTEVSLSAADLLATIPTLARSYDEPFADSSQVPTILVSSVARRSVTVALSGDAGDELFGGYERYRWTQSLWKILSQVPRPIRKVVRSLIRTTPVALLDRAIAVLGYLMPSLSSFHAGGDKLKRLGTVLHARTLPELYFRLLIHWTEIDLLVPAATGVATAPFHPSRAPERMPGQTDLEWMSEYDLSSYLPDDILCKVDRAAMSVSLESRVPLLDHRLVSFALSLPDSLRFRDHKTKWILRQVLARHVPEELFERPKRGFSIPLDQWLSGPLRSWASDLLEPISLRDGGIFNPTYVHAAWQQHLMGIRPRHNQLWSILMFVAWQREFFRPE